MKNRKIVGLSQFGLSWVGREGVMLEEHPYLFLSKKGEDPFIFAQSSLHELNDFCVTLFESIKTKAAEQPTFEQALKSAGEENGYDVTFIYAFGYKADDLGRMFGPASALIMLYANLIRSLHVIAKHYSPKNYENWRTTRDTRGAELGQLAALLGKICGEELNVLKKPRVRILLNETMRTLRNDFLHGNWEGVERRLVGVNLRSCFEIVSHILGALEEKFDEDRLLPNKYKIIA